MSAGLWDDHISMALMAMHCEPCEDLLPYDEPFSMLGEGQQGEAYCSKERLSLGAGPPAWGTCTVAGGEGLKWQSPDACWHTLPACRAYSEAASYHGAILRCTDEGPPLQKNGWQTSPDGLQPSSPAL